ncbi:hypothetical protein HYW60_02675 [Candidatus Kaiserbacteria bacterium]|nr:hypothetical protein [Candidatus Kaiserbacteria bacterium]
MPQKPGIDLNDTSNRIIAAIILALIFIGGWWLIARNAYDGSVSLSETEDVEEEVAGRTSESSPVNPTSVFGPLSEETPTIAGSRESVDVTDQLAGMSVKVKSATLAQMGWIAVRDADGRTLGAGRFEPGTHADIEVPLLRATTAGERYQVLIYVDDGDGEFDLHKDILVTGGDGSVAGDVFSAQ